MIVALLVAGIDRRRIEIDLNRPRPGILVKGKGSAGRVNAPVHRGKSEMQDVQPQGRPEAMREPPIRKPQSICEVEGTRCAANVSTGLGRGAGSPRVRAHASPRMWVCESIAGRSGRIFRRHGPLLRIHFLNGIG